MQFFLTLYFKGFSHIKNISKNLKKNFRGVYGLFFEKRKEEKLKRIEKERLQNIKKLSNNCIIEIDNCLPLELLKLQKNLMAIADGEGIAFVNVKVLQ